jgi:HEAT repeat protein
MSRPYLVSVAALVALFAAGCDRSESSTGAPRNASAEPSVVADATPTNAAATPAADEAQRADTVRTLQPRTTRAGTLRFTGPALRDPAAAAILVERLQGGGESSEVRAALAEALPRTGGVFAAAAVELLRTESDVAVREALADALGRTDDRVAIDGLVHALADADARVRTAAARSLGSHPAGAAAIADLRAALGDKDEGVQLAAIRSIGSLRTADPDTDAALARLLDDARVDVRLNALRALGRIDPAYTRTLPQLTQLRSDPDGRVAQLANELTATP